jgi:hypothetical protein
VICLLSLRTRDNSLCLLHIRKGELVRLVGEFINQLIRELDVRIIRKLFLPVYSISASLIPTGIGETAVEILALLVCG